MQRTAVLLAAAITLILAAPALAAAQTRALRPPWTKNCTALNKRYPHGVGRFGAHDRTKSGDPVTNFRRSNLLYRIAMRWNPDLDRDGDKIACEKH
jgi:hypothetical protein